MPPTSVGKAYDVRTREKNKRITYFAIGRMILSNKNNMVRYMKRGRFDDGSERITFISKDEFDKLKKEGWKVLPDYVSHGKSKKPKKKSSKKK